MSKNKRERQQTEAQKQVAALFEQARRLSPENNPSKDTIRQSRAVAKAVNAQLAAQEHDPSSEMLAALGEQIQKLRPSNNPSKETNRQAAAVIRAVNAQLAALEGKMKVKRADDGTFIAWLSHKRIGTGQTAEEAERDGMATLKARLKLASGAEEEQPKTRTCGECGQPWPHCRCDWPKR